MNPKMWKELKSVVQLRAIENPESSVVLKIMCELERRDLPQRVAEIMKDVDFNKRFCIPGSAVEPNPHITWCRYKILEDIWYKIIDALDKCDTSEIEKWRE